MEALPEWARLENWHALDLDELMARLAARRSGLTASEARERSLVVGPNTLPRAQDRHLLLDFLRQFTHLMAVLLWTGAAIALAIGLPALAVAIVVVIVVNGVFSFWQEVQAERATEELGRLLPQDATVIRAGKTGFCPASALVPGDILVLNEGDSVPADARLLDAHQLATNDAALTGESTPVTRRPKGASLGEASPVEAEGAVFAGTTIASGRGIAVVTATAERTVFGGVAGLTRRVAERPSPLQTEMDRAVRAISLVAITIGVTLTSAALIWVKLDSATALTFALGLIVAFVPEGLLPTLTLSLAFAVRRMAQRRALVKHLASVEALGAATVIATDKTGVLTQNRMSVALVWVPGREFRVYGAGYQPQGQLETGGREAGPGEMESLAPLLRVAALCNYARLRAPSEPGQDWEIVGDPTEGALQVLAARGGLPLDAARDQLPGGGTAAEWPFDAERQRMTVAVETGQGLMALTKGSRAAVLSRCDGQLVDGKQVLLDASTRAAVEGVQQSYAERGFRVLALAQRELRADELAAEADRIERGLTLLGLAAMQDPPRPEVAGAVARCREAGMRIIIISGDQGRTVAAIGRQVGIVTGTDPRVVEGDELRTLSDAALQEVLQSGREVIFARTPPEGKLRVVSALQAGGEIVAVTGDGVNDAPALRQADIGVAMGRAGTDVARAAADMVLADDNFASIVAAVEEGRAVFDNIGKFTTYCFTSNAAEAVPFVLFLLSGGKIPLALPIMLVLAVDLGTDLFPALALGAEAADPDVMKRPPRRRMAAGKGGLISRSLLLRSLLWLGLLEGAAGMGAFFASGGAAGALARGRAAAFAGIVAAQVANLFVCRSDRTGAFQRSWNPLLTWGIGLELALLLAIVYAPPLQRVFETAAMRAFDWLVPLAVVPVFFLLEEGRKRVVLRQGTKTG